MQRKGHRLCYTCHLKPARRGSRQCTTCQVFRIRNGYPRPHHLITRGQDTIRRPPSRHFTPPATVYVFFDASDRVLFVGMSVKSVKGNSLEHFCREEFWGRTSYVRMYHFETADEATNRTEEMIIAARPPFNTEVGEVMKAVVVEPEEEYVERQDEEDEEDEEEYYD